MPKNAKQAAKEPVYTVEVITKARAIEEDKWEYYVKWLNYGEDENTYAPPSKTRLPTVLLTGGRWESQENLYENCKDLLVRFWDHIPDTEEFGLRQIVSAPEDWIEQEKRAAQTLAEQQVEENASPKKPKTKKAKVKKERTKSASPSRSPSVGHVLAASSNVKTKRRASNARIPVVADSDDSDDAPVASSSKPPKKEPEKANDSSDSDDEPLSSALSRPTKKRKVEPAAVPSNQVDKTNAVQEASTSKSSVNSPAVPSHRARQVNPRVRRLDLVDIAANKGSTLPVKARLAQTLSPVETDRPSARVSALSGLSFKKQKPEPAPAAPEPEPEPEPLVAPSPPSGSLFNASPPPSPPQPATNDNPDLIDLFAEEHPLEYASSTRLPPQPTPAEEFLSTVMPPELAAPMDEDVPDVPSTSLLATVKPPPSYRIPKKFKWGGDLFVSTGPEEAKRACRITIHEPSEPLAANALTLPICFNSVDSLRLSKMHQYSYLHAVLPACRAPQQFAKVIPESKGDEYTLSTFANYLTARRSFTHSVMTLGGEAVGLLLLVPSSFAQDCSDISVPPRFSTATCDLLVILLPWALGPKEFQSEVRPRSDLPPNLLTAGQELAKLEKHQPTGFVRAIKILLFPQDMYNKVSQPNRTYSTWPLARQAPDSVAENLEIRALSTVLAACGASYISHNADTPPRLVFVHVGYLRTLHQLSSLLDWRAKSPNIQFISYGSHDAVNPDRWGFREIFPLGGVITFTPQALMQNMLRIIDLCEQYQLWDAYVQPSAVGAAFRLSAHYGSMGGNDMDSSRDDAYDEKRRSECNHPSLIDLLEAIDTGRLSLLTSPPAYRDGRAAMDWLNDNYPPLYDQSISTEERCLRISRQRHPTEDKAHLTTAVLKELAQDVLDLQMQPAIIDKHRRFVVIKGETEETPRETAGLEWTTADDFHESWFKQKIKPLDD